MTAAAPARGAGLAEAPPSIPAWLLKLLWRPAGAMAPLKAGWSPWPTAFLLALTGVAWCLACFGWAFRGFTWIGEVNLMDFSPVALATAGGAAAALVLLTPVVWYVAAWMAGGRGRLGQTLSAGWAATALWAAPSCAILLGARGAIWSPVACGFVSALVMFRVRRAVMAELHAASGKAGVYECGLSLFLGAVVAAAAGVGLLDWGRAAVAIAQAGAGGVVRQLADDPAGSNAAATYAPLLQKVLLNEEERKRVVAAAKGGPPDPALAALVEARKGDLELLRAGSELPYLDLMAGKVPSIQIGTPIPVFAGLVDAARLLLLDARLSEQAGRIGPAAADYTAVLGLAGQLAQDPQRMLISQLVATLLVETAAPALASFVGGGVAGPTDYTVLRGRLGRLQAPALGLEAALAAERELFSRSTPPLAEVALAWYSAGARERALADLKATLERVDAEISAAARANDAPRLESFMARLAAEAPRSKLWKEKPSLGLCSAFPRRFGACAMAAMPLPRYHTIISRSYLASANLAVLDAALAIRQAEAAGRRPAAKLDALVPIFLPSVPVDPFSGSPLRYALDGRRWRVYSVGPDRKDDGGAPIDPALDPAKTSALRGDVVIAGEAPVKRPGGHP